MRTHSSHPALGLPILALLVVALGGCGVDCTRTMWEHPWMADRPEHHQAAWQTGKVAEYGAKGVITPLAVTVDVVTDEGVWGGVLVVGWVALEVLSCGGGGGDVHGACGSSHGHGHHHSDACL